MVIRSIGATLLVVAAASAGCNALLGIREYDATGPDAASNPTTMDGSVVGDAPATPDSGSAQSDGAMDAGTPGDGGLYGCTDASLTCDGACVPNDNLNCGACGHDCTSLPNVTGSVACSAGTCVFDAGACKPGTAHCSTNADQGCETDVTSASHCGACDNACEGGAPLCAGSGTQYACASGCPSTAPTICNTTMCVDTTSSAANCKTCGNVCMTSVAHATATCNSSQCGVACTSSYPNQCNGGCVDYTRDNANCGGCGTACGPRQTCVSSHCTCNADPTCTAAGTFCSGSTLTACATDSNSCVYNSGSTACTNGACTGTAGSASCCTNVCTAGGTQCGGGGKQFCTTLPSGCMGWGTSSCGTGLVCEPYAGPTCADPAWAEWPMPNGKADVTAGAPHAESYTDQGDGSVTDNVTKLMWQKSFSSATFPLSNAASYCQGLSLAGHTDWRLPSLIELVSLLDLSSFGPSINTTFFPGTPSTPFWSSTGYAGAPTVAWYVIFAEASGSQTAPTNAGNTSTAYNVRCVR